MRWLASAVLLLAGIASAAPGYPHVGCYAATSGGGFPIVDGGAGYDAGQIKALAKFQTITLNLTPWFDFRPGIIDTLRALHPGPEKLVVLAYDQYGCRFPYATTGTIWKALWDNVNDGGTGILYGLDGAGFVDGSLNQWPNLSRPELTRAQDSIWINLVVNTGKCDGLFWDTTTGVVDDLGNSPGGTVNDYVRAGYASAAIRDTLRCQNIVTATSRMRTAKPGLIVVANGSLHDTTDCRRTWNGNMQEAWANAAFPYSKLPEAIPLYMANGPYSWIASYTGFGINSGTTGITAQTDNGTDAYRADNCQQMRFGLGCACLGAGVANYSNSRNVTTDPAAHTYYEWWYDEYSVNPVSGLADTSGAHTGWMGQALGPGVQYDTGLWYRFFQHGAVLLNTTGATRTIPLDDSHRHWRHIAGVRETIINNGRYDGVLRVGAHDAVFLVAMDEP